MPRTATPPHTPAPFGARRSLPNLLVLDTVGTCFQGWRMGHRIWHYSPESPASSSHFSGACRWGPDRHPCLPLCIDVYSLMPPAGPCLQVDGAPVGLWPPPPSTGCSPATKRLPWAHCFHLPGSWGRDSQSRPCVEVVCVGAMCCILRDAKNNGEPRAFPLTPCASRVTSSHPGLHGRSCDR